MTAPILRAANLHKTFLAPEPLHILNNISLEAYPGESIAITGRSGSGKTTLLHILGTLEPCDSGHLEIASTPTLPKQNARCRNRHIGFIFQAFNLLEDFTALENVLMPARIAHLPATRAYGLSLLAKVNLADRADFPAKHLSGGERQRVAIARALCNNPEIIFADEPSGNLDQANADLVSNLLFNLVAQEHKTLLLVTHDLELAARCTRRYTLSNGTLH
jgi:lipoprotein-releasing system ATP-binding protein